MLPQSPLWSVAFLCVALLELPASAFASSDGTALVRHAPTINGMIDGSVRQSLPENVSLNGGATVTGDLLVPGTPRIRLNGKPAFAGVVDSDGQSSPSAYAVTLNGRCSLRNLIRRVDGVSLPTVLPPAPPPGSRTINVSSPGMPIDDWPTVRNLTLNGNVGDVVVPPGRYGTFTLNGGTGIVLGRADSPEPTHYDFEGLNLNGRARIAVRGPVVVTLSRGFSANGEIGFDGAPSWLELNIASGGLTLNGGAAIHGYVAAPNGSVIVNGNSVLAGGVICDRLVVNGAGILQLIDRAGPANQRPVADPQVVSTEEGVPVSITLTGSDPEGQALGFSITSNAAHGTVSLAGAVARYTPGAGFAGGDRFEFTVSDGEFLSLPAAVAITVVARPVPPVGVADTFSTDENTILAIAAPGVLANDQDSLGRALSAEVAAGVLKGTLSVRADGGFEYTPAAGEFGMDGFTYRPIAGGIPGLETPVSLAINARPRPVDRFVTTVRNAAVVTPLTATDPDGAAPRIAVVSQPAHGVLLEDGAGSYRYQPDLNFLGADAFEFSATDEHGASATGTISLQVLGSGVLPIARFAAHTDDRRAPFEVTFDGSESVDPDGAISSYRWDFNGDGVNDAEGATVTHVFAQGGVFRAMLTVADGDGLTSSVVHEVRLNRAPEVRLTDPGPLARFAEGATVPVAWQASDPDGVLATVELFVDGNPEPAVAGVERSRVLSGLAVGAHEILVRVTDDGGATAESERRTFVIEPSRAAAGNFVVHPDLRVAALPAVPGLADGGAGRENATSLPIFADNFYPASVDYVLKPGGDEAGGFSGYIVQDSDVSSDVAYAWEDISLTGTKLDISNVDDGFQAVPLSFDFWFYHTRFQTVFVGTNGVLSFGAGTRRRFAEEIPSPQAPHYLLAPFWADLLPGYQAAGGGGYGGGWSEPSAIYVQEFGDRLVVQYSADAQFYGAAPDPENGFGLGVSSYNLDGTYTFQVILHRNGDIDYVYRWMTGVLWNATIGLQNGEGTEGIQLAYWSDFVTNHRLIRFKGTPVADRWFTLDRGGGSLAPGQSERAEITFHAKPDFPPGVYHGEITAEHTQPGLPPLAVDVALEIVRQDPVVQFTAPRPSGRHYMIAGDTVPLRIAASDEDGAIRKVTLSGDGGVLKEWAEGPFSFDWTPPNGLHALAAVALDNSGRTGTSEPLEISASVDSDGDRLPDAWEMDFLGTLEEDGGYDDDYDGRLNQGEYFHGSSPTLRDPEPVPNERPVARAKFAQVSDVAPYRVTFDARGSFDPDGTALDFLWDFDGDGSWDAFEPNVEHTFATEGDFPITLLVGDAASDYDEIDLTVRVRASGSNGAPVAAFEASPYAAAGAREVRFDASGSHDDGGIASYRWEFGDGATGWGRTMEHYYSTVGVYPVRLTVTDDENASATVTKYITITHRDQSVFQERNGFLVLEAEHATTFDAHADVYGWRICQADTGDPAWGASLKENANGFIIDPPLDPEPIAWDRAAELAWRVRIQTSGVYFVAVRYATGTLDDTGTLAFRLGVDGVEVSPPGGDPLGHSFGAIWRRAVSLGYLEAGEHDVAIRRQSDLAWIDQVVLSADKDALPADGSDGPALAGDRRPGLVADAPVARITGMPDVAGLPVELTLDASESTAGRGLDLTAWNWRIDRAVNPQDETVSTVPRAVSDQSQVSLEIEDFGASTAAFVAADTARLELTVVDANGQIGRSAQEVALYDPLESATAGLGLVVDTASAGFSAGPGWQAANQKCLFIQGVYYPGGVQQYLDEGGISPSNPLGSAVQAQPINLVDWHGDGAMLSYAADPADAATFTPDLAASGDYFVFVHWPRHDKATADDFVYPVANDVTIVVRDAAGESEYRVDQRRAGGHWRLLGVHTFTAGATGSVRINPVAGELVFADAVKFVPIPATVGDGPQSRIEADVLEGGAVAFDGRSSSGSILAWFWEFGDGRTSRGRHPVHSYAGPGSYPVRLTVIDDALRVGSSTFLATAAPPVSAQKPVARYSINAVRGRTPFVFEGDASASTDDGHLVSFAWKTTLRDEPWGNSSPMVAFGPTGRFVFNAPGVHVVTLEVTDDAGQSDSASFEVEALAPGLSTLPPLVIDNRAREASFAGAWERGQPIIGFLVKWLFRAGLEDAEPVVVQAARAFTGADFLQSTQIGDSAEFRPPIAEAGLYQVAVRYPTGSHEPPLDVTVVHAGGESHVALNHSVAPGDWQLLGTFRFDPGSAGCVRFARERATQEVYADAVRWTPVGSGTRASFDVVSQDSARVPSAISFDGTGSSSDTAIADYAWDFGDGGRGSGSNPNHTFAAAGTYPVTLTVTDDRGGSASCVQTVRVLPALTPPVAVADVAVTAGASGRVIHFSGSGSSDPDGIACYAWDFGDGTTFSGPEGYHRFDTAGVHRISLAVVDSLGASAEVEATVEIVPAATGFGLPRIDAAATGEGGAVAFRFPDAVDADSVEWDFGDGRTGGGATIEHTYSAPGVYLVSVTVVRDGASTTSTRWISVGEPSRPPDAPRSDPGAAFILYSPFDPIP